MAVNGITDIVTTVTVPKSEYEALLRESETLSIVKVLYETKKYIDADDMRNILGVGLVEKGGNE